MTNKSCWLSFYFCLHDSFLTCFLQWSLSPVYDTEMHWIWESSWDSPGEALRKRVWAVLIGKVSIRRLYSMRGRKSWGGEQEVNKHLVCQFHSNLLNPLQPTQWAAGITACTCGSSSPSFSIGFASIWLQIEGQGTAERRPQMGPIWFSCDHSNRAIYWLCCAEMEHLRSRSLVVLLGDRSGWDLSVFSVYTSKVSRRPKIHPMYQMAFRAQAFPLLFWAPPASVVKNTWNKRFSLYWLCFSHLENSAIKQEMERFSCLQQLLASHHHISTTSGAPAPASALCIAAGTQTQQLQQHRWLSQDRSSTQNETAALLFQHVLKATCTVRAELPRWCWRGKPVKAF